MRNKVRGGYPLALPELSAWRASAALGWGAALGVLFRFAGKGKGRVLDLGVWWARAGGRAAGSLLANGRAGLADPLVARPSALGGGRQRGLAGRPSLGGGPFVGEAPWDLPIW